MNIKVEILTGDFLHDFDAVGRMDPYIILEVNGQSFRTKTAHGQGKSPNFMNTFRLEASEEDELKFLAYDEDVTYDDYIGSATITVGEGISRSSLSILKVYNRDGGEEGTITVDITKA